MNKNDNERIGRLYLLVCQLSDKAWANGMFVGHGFDKDCHFRLTVGDKNADVCYCETPERNVKTDLDEIEGDILGMLGYVAGFIKARSIYGSAADNQPDVDFMAKKEGE